MFSRSMATELGTLAPGTNNPPQEAPIRFSRLRLQSLASVNLIAFRNLGGVLL